MRGGDQQIAALFVLCARRLIRRTTSAIVIHNVVHAAIVHRFLPFTLPLCPRGHAVPMNADLAELLRRHDGVVRFDEAVASVPRHVLKHCLARGDIVGFLQGVYVERERLDDAAARERAALLYAGSEAALSHISALRRWGLPVPGVGKQVHVTVPAHVRRRGRPVAVAIHRTLQPPAVLRRGGAPVTRLERTLVDSWSLLDGAYQRAPAIAAVAERKTTPARLLTAAQRCHNYRGHASLLALCHALAEGCRSELEVWGLRHVFRDDPRLAHGVRQHPVRLGSRTAYLDLAFVSERVAVELDGAAFHDGHVNRERDMRRDAALSALGWVVLRFSYWRLHDEPDVVRDEIAAVLVTRRSQLAA